MKAQLESCQPCSPNANPLLLFPEPHGTSSPTWAESSAGLGCVHHIAIWLKAEIAQSLKGKGKKQMSL